MKPWSVSFIFGRCCTAHQDEYEVLDNFEPVRSKSSFQSSCSSTSQQRSSIDNSFYIRRGTGGSNSVANQPRLPPIPILSSSMHSSKDSFSSSNKPNQKLKYNWGGDKTPQPVTAPSKTAGLFYFIHYSIFV